MTCPYCKSDNNTRDDFRVWDTKSGLYDNSIIAEYHCLNCGSDFHWCKRRGLLMDWEEIKATRSEQKYFEGTLDDE